MKDGYQPRLLDAYSHLFLRRQSGVRGRGNDVAYGTIKKLIEDRGFGFIRPDGYNQDLFFHRSAVEEPPFEQLKEGDSVQFSIERDHLHNENQAVKVRVAQKPQQSPQRRSVNRRDSMHGQYRSLEYRSLIGTARARNSRAEED